MFEHKDNTRTVEKGNTENSIQREKQCRRHGLLQRNSPRKYILQDIHEIITNRLSELTNEAIPECQFGFRKGKSTLQAAEALLHEIREALQVPRGKYYAVFIDYAKAFDFINRSKLMEKLENLTGSNHLTGTIKEILKYNMVQINDGMSLSRDVRQTNGVMQGDPISPLLFNITTAEIRDRLNGATLIMYADDMVIGSTNKEALQEALHNLEQWAKENEFKINKEKTVQMVFRKGGRIPANANLMLENEPLKIVNKFRYLGLSIQTTASSFNVHIQERTASAVRAIYAIKNLSSLSLATAMKLFHTTITPVVTYGLEMIWDKLSISDMERIEKVKARFLKRALGAGKSAPNRYMYLLARETYFIEDLRIEMTLPSNKSYNEVIAQRAEKQRGVDTRFFCTDAMIYRDWTKPNQQQRYAIIGLAIHGYHHKMCQNPRFHQPDEKCVCKYCIKECDRYHVLECKNRIGSLNDLIKDKL